MSYDNRKTIYDKISEERNSTVIAYVNNIRLPNAPICVVSTRYFYKIIKSLSSIRERLDLILITNGGDTNAPLRIINLLRCFFKEINVMKIVEWETNI